MKLAVGNLSPVVAEFFDGVLIPAALQGGGLRAFTVGFLGGVVSRNVPSMVDQFLPMAKSVGVVDENNLIDLEMVYEEATKALRKAPVVVSGYRVDQSDLDNLLNIARKYAQ